MGTTSAGSATAERSTKTARPSEAIPRATASASRVFPVPPGPVSVTSRVSGRPRRLVTAAISSSRPTSGVVSTGSSPDGASVASGGRRVQRWILPEDLLLERAQLGRGLEAELVEGSAGSAVGGERIRLATRTVEGEHLVGAKALAMRMGRNESLELCGERVVSSGGEVGGDAGLERAESGFLEPRSLRLGKRLGGEVGERRPAPERKRLARPTVGNEVLEALDVALALLDAEHVARCAGHDPVGAERVAKRVDMYLERVRGAGGGRVSPDPVDQPVGRDRLVGMEQQEREQRPRSSATERDFGPVVTPDFQGAKLPELHALRLPRPLSGAF